MSQNQEKYHNAPVRPKTKVESKKNSTKHSDYTTTTFKFAAFIRT